ncbi:aldehyde-activating protein [Lysobacter sp. S4-A87]|uniref:GFA family protein n=1 Tax=Lysobacter sp. S4-A87 TaxID=2925843 RepID=UPI001F52E02C|nr:aldehyde-activating protein [Lysobacter sp. S4-A87]UNK48352.1 aldehyde-activating protein [Lysobacter sp. S4-A87]
MTVAHASCHCRRLVMEATLTRPLHDYAPRACDCDFCRKHGAAWLTDPSGSLRLRQRGNDSARRYRQGSDQAEFIACAYCAVLVMATYESDGHLFAALNVRTIEGTADLAAEQVAQPRLLSAEDKPLRWQQLWFADVRIEVG